MLNSLLRQSLTGHTKRASSVSSSSYLSGMMSPRELIVSPSGSVGVSEPSPWEGISPFDVRELTYIFTVRTIATKLNDGAPFLNELNVHQLT